MPLLVVEIVSDFTRRRDLGPKKDFYRDVGVPTYWIVDGDARTIRAIRAIQPADEDVVLADMLGWHPAGAANALTIDV